MASKLNRQGGCGIIAVGTALILLLGASSCTDALRARQMRQARDAVRGVDRFMGDWQGRLTMADGTIKPLGAQVMALGNGKYRANLLEEFDRRVKPLVVLEGTVQGDKVRFEGRAEQDAWQGVSRKGKFTGALRQGQETHRFVMKRAFRLSPTLGAEPPTGAVVLFDGKNFDQWKRAGKKPGSDSVRWKLVDGAMEVVRRGGSIITKKEFTDFKLHLEFRTPFMPEARGQGRGNSGVYLQGRYEVQILDSYGLEGRDNECGGIYKVAAPRVNMCAAPMQWQTYDITFYAPRFNADGKKIRNARLTVLHNGVKIHKNVEVPGKTGGAAGDKADRRGGIYLQDHGNPVRFRNIWLVDLGKKCNE